MSSSMNDQLLCFLYGSGPETDASRLALYLFHPMQMDHVRQAKTISRS